MKFSRLLENVLEARDDLRNAVFDQGWGEERIVECQRVYEAAKDDLDDAVEQIQGDLEYIRRDLRDKEDKPMTW